MMSLLPILLGIVLGWPAEVPQEICAEGGYARTSVVTTDPGPPQVPRGAVAVERQTYLMGTVLSAVVETPDRSSGLGALERVFAEVRRMEDLLSTWRDDTELARLNSAPVGRDVPLSDELLSLLEEAAGWSRTTGGSFDPGVGPLIDVWDLRAEGRRPSDPELARALAATGIHRFVLDSSAGTARRTREGSWIDSGAFGKGAALRAAGRILVESGISSALLDFGGQILALGASPDDSDWTVGVAHPSLRQEPVATIRVRDASASTSAASERAVAVGGERFGHIVDPRSGRPVPAWGSVTVVASDALAADALSTALFVLGPEEAMQWARSRRDVGVLVLVEREPGVEAAWNDALEPCLVAVP